jgi:5-aminopentanamidase
MPVRIAIFQGPDDSGEAEHNLALLEQTARQAAAAGARLVIFSEMFLTGYNIGPAAASMLAQPVDGPAATRVAAVARETGIGIVYGYPERGSDGGVYNSALFIGPDGSRLANYRKCHLFGDLDRAMFRPGEHPVVTAEFEGLRVGFLICYDVEFPEPVRLLAEAGVDLVIVPTAQMDNFIYTAEHMIGIRAFENQVFVAYANRSGAERDLVYCGRSVVAGPDGLDLARAGLDAGLMLAEISPARLAASRAANPYLRDRRPELYGALAHPRHNPSKGD